MKTRPKTKRIEAESCTDVEIEPTPLTCQPGSVQAFNLIKYTVKDFKWVSSPHDVICVSHDTIIFIVLIRNLRLSQVCTY